MHLEGSVQQIQETLVTISSQRGSESITGVILVDATGRRRELPMDSAVSYEVTSSFILYVYVWLTQTQIFMDMIRALIFRSDTLETRIQRRYMENGNYDLCIDKKDAVVAIEGQEDWEDSEIRPGTTIVMRVIFWLQQVRGQYRCHRCNTLNTAAKDGPSIDWSVN